MITTAVVARALIASGCIASSIRQSANDIAVLGGPGQLGARCMLSWVSWSVKPTER